MDQSTVRLRRAHPADAESLAAFAARTFSEAFGADNRPEHLAAHLVASYGVAQQARELSDATYVTLLAEVGPELAAYAQLRRRVPPSCVSGPAAIELHRFYVDQPWHGRGLAQSLMSAVHAAAEELGCGTLWLSVWERNPRARAFYDKCGFRDVGTADFYVGPDRQTDRILVAPVGRNATHTCQTDLSAVSPQEATP
jgi:diamine N-acetyltransferase